MLARRAELLKEVRAFFDARGFLEVETPVLSADTVVDRHLDPFGVESRFLQTSPEFGMKRLLAAGAQAIYQITRAFRRDEFGPLHNPEFTILEWYRCGDDLERGMTLLAEFAAHFLKVENVERITYREAFQKFAGVDPIACEAVALKAAARAHDVSAPESLSVEDRDGWLNLLLAEVVEKHLGADRPAILFGYPPSQAALAIVSGNPPVAERFELYYRGIELANGYHELLDAKALRARNEQNNALRVRDGKEDLPVESRLLRAMERGLPPCSGVAVGFDRLLMAITGARHIRDVIAFPSDRA